MHFCWLVRVSLDVIDVLLNRTYSCNYLCQGGFVFIGVCLLVNTIAQKLPYSTIFTKFAGKVAHGLWKKR